MIFDDFVRRLEWSDSALVGIDWQQIRTLPLFAEMPALELEQLLMSGSVR